MSLDNAPATDSLRLMKSFVAAGCAGIAGLTQDLERRHLVRLRPDITRQVSCDLRKGEPTITLVHHPSQHLAKTDCSHVLSHQFTEKRKTTRDRHFPHALALGRANAGRRRADPEHHPKTRPPVLMQSAKASVPCGPSQICGTHFLIIAPR